MTLPQAVAEALRLIRSGAVVVTAEIERADASEVSRAVSVQYRFVKDKQCDDRYRVERRAKLTFQPMDMWSRWGTSAGFDVDDVLGQWQVRAITGKDSLYP